MAIIVPLLFIVLVGWAVIQRVNVYRCFTDGVKEAFSFVLSLIPCLTAVFITCELFEVSGVSQAVCNLLAPLFQVLGIPAELCRLVLIKPFSGSASLAVLNEILTTRGADSYIGRCACVCYGSSETVFYVSAVYFAKGGDKKLILPVIVVLIGSFIATVLSCLLCKFM